MLSTITCLDDGQEYPFQIVNGLTPELLFQADSEWVGARNNIFSEIIKAHPQAASDMTVLRGMVPSYNLEDWHWRWVDKSFSRLSTDFQWFFLLAQNNVQAVCIIYHPKKSSLIGDNIFYIDYLATAPWNRYRPNYNPRFKSLGTILVSHSISHAKNVLGYRPGFNLHSLPKAEGYYRKIGMVDLGVDATYENLRFFEADEAVSEKLLERSNG